MSRFIKILQGLILMCLFSQLEAQTVHLRITHIRNDQGRIKLSFYTDQESFDQDTPVLIRTYPKSSLSEGIMRVNVDLSPGVYGIALLDDENMNNDMDYSLLGIPREGFGFSGILNEICKRPKFSDFQFEVGKKDISLEIRVNYK